MKTLHWLLLLLFVVEVGGIGGHILSHWGVLAYPPCFATGYIIIGWSARRVGFV